MKTWNVERSIYSFQKKKNQYPRVDSTRRSLPLCLRKVLTLDLENKLLGPWRNDLYTKAHCQTGGSLLDVTWVLTLSLRSCPHLLALCPLSSGVSSITSLDSWWPASRFLEYSVPDYETHKVTSKHTLPTPHRLSSTTQRRPCHHPRVQGQWVCGNHLCKRHYWKGWHCRWLRLFWI